MLVRKHWRFWLGLFTSLVFLWLAFRGQNLGQIRDLLAAADYRYLAPAVLIYFAGVVFRTARWRVLLRPVKTLSAPTLFPIVVIGYMANNLLPARTGELVRAYVLSVREGVSKSTSLATIAIERIFDGLTMILFVLVASLLIRLNEQMQALTILATAIFSVLLLGLVGYAASRRFQRFVLAPLYRFLPTRIAGRLEAVATAFIEGLASLRSGPAVLMVIATSILAWLSEAGMYLIVATAFNLEMTWSVALLTTAIANLFTLLPSSPGYVGIFEAGVLAVLVGLLAYPEAQALSYALLLHVALWLPVTLLGLVFWFRESLSWRDLSALPPDAEAVPKRRVSSPTRS